MSAGIFITGTDTGVGKTYIACGIASALSRQGTAVGVMKPAESGCERKKGRLIPRDALRLMEAAQVTDALDLVNPYRLSAPLAPAVAAEREGREIVMTRILNAFHVLVERHRFLIVEGAGGIMVPLSRRLTFLDLAARMGLPVLIVARPGLGTINHTALTVMAVRSRNLPIAGIVLNDSSGGRRGTAERTNPGVIERMTGLPVLGSLRFGQRVLPKNILRAVQ